jgi:hypothetical protein
MSPAKPMNATAMMLVVRNRIGVSIMKEGIGEFLSR